MWIHIPWLGMGDAEQRAVGSSTSGYNSSNSDT